MQTKKITKQLHYKQATFLQPVDITLQDMLRRALHKLKVIDRQETISEYAVDRSGEVTQQWLRFINSPRKSAGFQFGTIVSYSSSVHHLAIEIALDKEKDEVDVSKIPPPEGQTFIETPLYFAIRDNHVVIIQSTSLRADAFRRHLNWLLRAAGVFQDNQSLELDDTIPEETKKKMGKNPVKSITLQAPFFETAAAPVASRTQPGVIEKFKVATGMGLDLLKGVLTKQQFEGLRTDQMQDVPDVQVKLEIKIVGKKKENKSADQSIMRDIMKTMQHIENADAVNAEVEGVGTIKGTHMRVHDHRGILSIDGVLNTSDAYETMRSWLEHLLSSGSVRAD